MVAPGYLHTWIHGCLLLPQDAVSFEPSYKNSDTNYSAVHESESNGKTEEPDYQEAISQREPEYESETVYEVTGAQSQYPAGLIVSVSLQAFSKL